MKTIIYTFTTFPLIDLLRATHHNVLVFHKLKQDIVRLEEQINATQPDLVLGIAAHRSQSRFEPVAINRFNKNGRVLHGGPETLDLYTPKDSPTGFGIATKPTTSFCNWTMYRVQSLINTRGLTIRFAFVHINPKDTARLSTVLASVKCALY